MSPIQGRKIQRLREKKGLSMRALARESGVRYATLFAIEHETAKRVTVETLEALAHALDVSVSELLTGRNRQALAIFPCDTRLESRALFPQLSPVLHQLADDPVVRAASRASVLVYVKLLALLDLVEYRPCKVTALAHDLQMKPHTVSRIMKVLVERGFLGRRYAKHRGYEYRLVFSVSPPASQPPDRWASVPSAMD